MAKALTHIRSLARTHTDRAIAVLQGIMDNGTTESARVAAANSLLDRGWGKPAQPINGDEDGGAVRVELVRRLIVDPGHSDSESVPPAT